MSRKTDPEMEAIEKQIIKLQQRLLRRLAKGSVLNPAGHDHEAVAALSEAASYIKLMTWATSVDA